MFERAKRRIQTKIERERRRFRVENLPKGETWIEVNELGFNWRLNLDHYLDKELATTGQWEAETVALVNKLLKPGMCVVDVGANFGIFSLVFSRLVGEYGKVIAFEPTSDYSERLLRHIELNNIKNVALHQLGLSDHAASVEISIGNSSATLQPFSSERIRKTEKIDLVTFDTWWQKYLETGQEDRLDFVKVDIDGHEPQFLRGAKKTLERLHPLILIEFAQEHLYFHKTPVWELADSLEAMGYILCNVKDGIAYEDRLLLLKDTGNYAWSANVLARPQV